MSTTHPVPPRYHVRFSASGAHAAALIDIGGPGTAVEAWSFDGGGAKRWAARTEAGERMNTQPVPTEDGRVVLVRNNAGTHELVLIDESDERLLAVVNIQALRLMPSPKPDVLAVALGYDGATSVIWRIVEDEPSIVEVARLSGMAQGGCWLDVAGCRLGVNLIGDGPVKPLALDLTTGVSEALPTVTGATRSHLLLASASSGALLLLGDVDGELRLAIAGDGGVGPADPAPGLNSLSGKVKPLAIAPGGDIIAMQVDRGVRSHLMLYHVAQDVATEVELPPGHLDHDSVWSDSGLRLVLSEPSRPPEPITVEPSSEARPAVLRQAPDADTPWADAHLELLDGPAGPLEAVVYGEPDWRDSSQLMMVLHGGPEAGWRLEFNLLLQHFVSAGIALVAPNPRGSTGYGPAYRDAVRGAWGGPDLADIVHVAQSLAAHRRAAGRQPMMVYGSSYGAYLALLAASVEPTLWSRCVAVAPFISGARLHENGTPSMRRFVDGLRGTEELRDDIGPRDLNRLAPNIRAPLLLIHGDMDEVIPVEQSRALRTRLIEAGRHEGVDFRYLEVAGGSHSLPPQINGQPYRDQITEFLRCGFSPETDDGSRRADGQPDANRYHGTPTASKR